MDESALVDLPLPKSSLSGDETPPASPLSISSDEGSVGKSVSKKRHKSKRITKKGKKKRGAKKTVQKKKRTANELKEVPKFVGANSPFMKMLDVVVEQNAGLIADDVTNMLSNYYEESNILVSSYVTGLPNYFKANPNLRASMLLITVAMPELLDYKGLSSVLAIDRLGMVLVPKIRGRDVLIAAIEKVGGLFICSF